MERHRTVYFLLVYSFDEGKLIGQQEFTDSNAATTAYGQAEADHRGKLDKFEIVLVGADSIETVMKTHGHYFHSSDRSLFSEFLTEDLLA
ncbi:hypothetical protein HH310_27765 [Actinoplanes sp. TBRC 11911]|uniref:hypothetical protein n=1 Tax=Actinoplanes sp. TBRC 11911 TaxID=2729386 RepID=UPI00145EC590|nr:hypothetical protein [Actinoplanes sp. TBRC 11911]NMO54968.1 hypothetical protein [Actinoplanes sp. TBRC 11911]